MAVAALVGYGAYKGIQALRARSKRKKEAEALAKSAADAAKPALGSEVDEPASVSESTSTSVLSAQAAAQKTRRRGAVVPRILPRAGGRMRNHVIARNTGRVNSLLGS